MAEELSRQEWVVDVESQSDDELIVSVASLEDAETRLMSALAQAGARVVSFAPEAVSLERAFLELTR